TRVFAAVTEENDASLGLFGSLGFEKAPRRALRRWYGWRGLSVELRMVLVPHEALMVRTFTDPSPRDPQAPCGAWRTSPGGVRHARLDHRCLRLLRPRLDGPPA